jgi:predicted membrane protein
MTKKKKNQSNIVAVVMIIAFILFFFMRFFPNEATKVFPGLTFDGAETVSKAALAVFYVSLALFIILLPFVAVVVKIGVVAIAAIMIWKMYRKEKNTPQLNDK